MSSNNIDFPTEIVDKLQAFHHSLNHAEEVLKVLLSSNINSTDLNLSPLDKARLNLTSGYALNSLFWMYLNTLGIDPKEHKIKTELERFKSYMLRVKEVADKEKAPSLDKGAAKRFVRNALWQPSNSKGDSEEESPESSLKRRQELNGNSSNVKRTKTYYQ